MSVIIEYVKEYPTMHHFGIPRYTQSLIAMKIWTKCFWVFKFKIVGMLLKCTVVMYLALHLPVYAVAEVGGIP